ncbi:glycosyltransferase family 1 protein [bacterium]|nr:MAG: glycosyltransferase family 1 protein [bacterium]
MKILYWTSLYWPDAGGIEVLALETLPALRERGYEFTVIANFGNQPAPAYCEQNGIPVHRLPFLPAFLSRNIREQMELQKRVAAIKSSFAPDLVHLNFVGHPPYFHLRTQKAYPAPTLMVAHSDFSGIRGTPDTIFGQCLRSADWICGVSRATLDDVMVSVPEKAERSSVIYNGLAMPTLPPTPLPFETPHILCMGRLSEEKGFDIALRAFARQLERHPLARMSVVGEGHIRPDLEALSAELGLGQSVVFTGRLEREAIAPMINTATMVVVPSRYREPFALVALEAAQMARPVIATRWGGLPENVAEGESGLLVENENVGAFADAMGYLLENPDVARSMGKRGRERARDVFGLKNCVDAYDALYQQLGRKSGD